jgi:diguanylate cyclase (GGDEF)-like protein
LAELAQSVGADAGVGLFLADDEGVLRAVATRGDVPIAPPRPRRGLHLGGPAHPAPTGATLLLPVPDRRTGFLYLARRGYRPFTEADRTVAGLYARQLASDAVAPALANATSSWARQLEAIQAIAAQLTRLASVEDVGLALCVETRQVIDYHNCRFYVLDPNGIDLVPVAFRGELGLYQGETIEALRCQVGEGLTGLVAATGESLIIPDAARDPRALDIPGTDTIEESMLLVPLRYEGRVTGVVVLSKLGLEQFDADDLRLLQILADQAAVAVENARLLAGRDLLVAELNALLEMSQAGNRVVDERTLATSLARQLCTAAAVEACVISRWEPGSTMLRTIARHGSEDMEPSYDILDFPATRRVLRDHRPLVVQAEDPDADPAELGLMRRFGEQTVLLLPLLAGAESIGLIELVMGSRRRDFTEHELDFCLTMANQAGTVLENARLLDHLRRVADVDQLTGVANHRHLQERLAQEVARASRTGRPLTLLMIDLDGFKAVNDRYGHADGDRVLRDVAAALKVAVRANDIVARYGGDEFVVLMPDTAEGMARTVAGRVVEGVRGRTHQLTDGTEIRLSASAGLAVHPEDGRTPAALLRAADASMYAVKRAGGGGVERRRARAGRASAAVAGSPAAGERRQQR